MKEKVEVVIAGKKYTVMGMESPEYIQKVTDYVNGKMQMLTDNNHELTAEGAAVLTAINVADDYFKSEDTAANLRTQLGEYFRQSGGGGK
ncbi:MAG: cell division protein ZapA [Clostridiales bacterium]|jgi:cell division protein ZapA|nr:cell division protein ZapA [Clostridiales bacterium]